MEKKFSNLKDDFKRLFIAIDFLEETKSKLYAFQEEIKRSIWGDIKWVERENFHLTLKFLGEVSIDLIEDIKEVMVEVSNYVNPFYISLKGFGAFPSFDSPRVLWIGIEEGIKELEMLFGLLEKRLVKKGFEKERKAFSPHLTLGRVKSRNLKISREYSFSEEKIFVEEITLFESKLTQQGPIYTPIFRIKLGKK